MGLPQNAPAPEAPAEAHYSQIEPTRDGIGKVYMGREISFTLGHIGIPWLEREGRESQERPDLLVESMDLSPDDVLADLGAGSGYMSFLISPYLPQGKVLAVDIEPLMLDEIRRKLEDKKVENITTVHSTESDPKLPDSSVDAVLIVDAYHEFSHPREMMQGVLRGLVPGGRLFLIEFRGEDPHSMILPLHKMTEAQVRLEMQAVGFEFVENKTLLPKQHFLVFRKPE